jgi:ABC-type uncharacterized transport system auxiliary subunit
MIERVVLFVLVLGSVACGGKSPETRYYQLAAPPSNGQSGAATIVLEPLATDAGYDDERIVYRANPYRFDYYQYHRWSAAPGVMVGNYLEQALESSGRFRAVVREPSTDSQVILGGRVVAIEEVDSSRSAWLGRIVVELTLTDAKTGAALWQQQFEENEPLPAQNPEGLARALSTAMHRIASKAAPLIADLADRQAVVHAAQTTIAGERAP